MYISLEDTANLGRKRVKKHPFGAFGGIVSHPEKFFNLLADKFNVFGF